MDFSKKVILDGKYELGIGVGCWAKSYERNVKVGDLRKIGDKLMFAYNVWPKSGFFFMFTTYEVNWVPVDAQDTGEYNNMRAWVTKGLV